jgi:hypothetical protein
MDLDLPRHSQDSPEIRSIRNPRSSILQFLTHMKAFAALTAVLLVAPSAALAQQDFIKSNVAKLIRKVGVHANASFRAPVDRDLTGGRTYGISIGLSPGQTNGWRYPFALVFFSEHLQTPTNTDFAKLRARALLGGIGYGWHFGKLSTGVSLQAGYGIYSLRGEGDVFTALDAANGPVTMDVTDTWLLRPQLKAEYFLTRKITVRVSGDYVFTQPDIVVITPAGRITIAGMPATSTRTSGLVSIRSTNSSRALFVIPKPSFGTRPFRC